MKSRGEIYVLLLVWERTSSQPTMKMAVPK